MSAIDPSLQIHTGIWREEAEPSDRFRTQAAFCRGYDVFGELVGRMRWVEMLLLQFRDDLPSAPQLDMLEALAVAIANPGPRDASVHAAMCAGVGGSTAAAALMAALAVGAGGAGGAREVFDAMVAWERCGPDFEAWNPHVCETDAMDIWPQRERAAGFDAHGLLGALPVRQLLEALAHIAASPRVTWLEKNQAALEQRMGAPLALAGVAAAAFSDLGLRAVEGEMLYLLLRLPGAAAHALEQQAHGYRNFPFPPVELVEQA